MLGTEEEKLFDAPLSISKREQLEQPVGVGRLGRQALVLFREGSTKPLSTQLRGSTCAACHMVSAWALSYGRTITFPVSRVPIGSRKLLLCARPGPGS